MVHTQILPDDIRNEFERKSELGQRNGYGAPTRSSRQSWRCSPLRASEPSLTRAARDVLEHAAPSEGHLRAKP